MKKNFRIFWLFAKYSFKTTFQNKIGVVLFSCAKLLRFGMFFMFVYYLLQNTKILAGYTMNQTLIFYLTYNIIDTLSQLLFREVYRFRPLIITGEFNSVLVKPYHPFMRILIGGIDMLDLFIVFIYGGLLTYFVTQLGSTAPLYISSFVLLVINALIISASFHIAVLAMGIITTDVDHTIMIYRDMTKLGSFPIDIYIEPIRTIFTFVVPVGIMMTFPVKSLFGILPFQFILISFFFSGMAMFGALKLWDRAIKQYQSWGG